MALGAWRLYVFFFEEDGLTGAEAPSLYPYAALR
jgi:hypothetical protein